MSTEAPSPRSRAGHVASIKDVAERAGVSRATASYTFTQPRRVSEQLRERVLAAAAELGYVGNDAARRLRAGRSSAFGLLISNTANPVYAELAAGAEREAAAHGRHILMVNSGDDAERERDYIGFFEAQQVSGIIAAPVGEVPVELQELSERGIPFVLVGHTEKPHDYPAISGDNVLGGRLAVEHLLAQGRRRLLFVGGPHPHVDARLAGAREAVSQAEEGAGLEVIRVSAQNAHVGEEVAAELLSRPAARVPDGIFAGNDLLALGLLHGLFAGGISVPRDLSLIGYDDIEFSDFAIVPLSTIRHPSAALGASAVRLLLGLDTEEQLHGRFAPELIVRQTSLR